MMFPLACVAEADVLACVVTSCAACDLGKYNNAVTQSSCVACTSDKPFTKATGTTNVCDCVASSMTCVLCGAGKFSQDGAGKCSKCPAGQYVDTSGAEGCLACDLATFSFEGRTRACDSCPVGAKCVGGVLQGAKPGFWRQKHASELNNDSLRFYRCLTDSNCPNTHSSCLAHAIGPVCALCEEGYQKSATGSHQSTCPG